MKIISTLEYSMSKKIWMENLYALDVHRFLRRTAEEDGNECLIVLGVLDPTECSPATPTQDPRLQLAFAHTHDDFLAIVKAFNPDLAVLNGYFHHLDSYIIDSLPDLNTVVRIRCDLPLTMLRYPNHSLPKAKKIWISFEADKQHLRGGGFEGGIEVCPGGLDLKPFKQEHHVSPEGIDLTLFKDTNSHRDIDFASILHHNPMKGGDIAKGVIGELSKRGYKTELLGYLPQQEFADRLKRTKVFYFPSPMFDGCPRAPREAMYAGCRVVFDSGSNNCRYLMEELGGRSVDSNTRYIPDLDMVITERSVVAMADDMEKLLKTEWTHNLEVLENKHDMNSVYKFFKESFIK